MRFTTTKATLFGLLIAAACTLAGAQSTQAKKDLAAKAVQLQLPAIEALARGLVEQPASQMLREAAQILQERVPADQREAVGKRLQDSARKYVDEAVPLVSERAVKLAPANLGAALEERFTEDELKQLVTWLESPLSRKYQQAVPEIQRAFVQKLVAESRPAIDPKLQSLEQTIRGALTAATASAPKAPPAKASAAPGGKPAGK